MEDSTSVTAIELVLVLLAVPGFLVAVVCLLGGRKRVASWGRTLWRAMVRAWMSRWVPLVFRMKTTMLVYRHERALRTGHRQPVGYRRYDGAQRLFESGTKALRRYILHHTSILKTTSTERYTFVWVAEGPYSGVWDSDPWGSPYITKDDAFLDHVAKIRTYDIADSWHLAVLHRWWRCRQKIRTTWTAARRRRQVPRDEHEARRIRRIHWFAWPIALPVLAWIVWLLIEKALAP